MIAFVTSTFEGCVGSLKKSLGFLVHIGVYSI